MTKTRKFLMVDDDLGDGELLRRNLEQACPGGFDFRQISGAMISIAQISGQDADLIFLDYMLGATSGLEILTSIRTNGDLRPVIILTGQGDENVAAECMRSGADDYLIKAKIDGDSLRRAINGAYTEFLQRKTNIENQELLEKLRVTTEVLERKNRRLADLYETAHQFVDNVSHEFRTPLTVIKEFTEIINDGLAGPVTEEQREYLNIVIQRVDDLTILVNDMLDTSKIEAGLLGIARRDCDAREIIDRIRPAIDRRVASKASVVIEMDDNLPPIYCDPEKIGRVLINLVINAQKYGGEEGKIKLSVSVDRDNESNILFSVTDNGPGMPSESLKIIFERFHQIEKEGAAPDGFGLGLDIARQLVHLNFGEISVTSEIGVGSTFSFTVPVAERTSLIQHYKDCVRKRLSESTTLAFVSAQTERLSEKSYEAADRFLQGQMRQNDLLIRTSTNAWMIIAATNDIESKQYMDRIEKAQTDFVRTHPGADIPVIEFELRCITKINDHLPPCIKDFGLEKELVSV